MSVLPTTWKDLVPTVRPKDLGPTVEGSCSQVLEFYGATEGNGALCNLCHRSNKEARGAVGRFGKIANKITGMKIVNFDVVEEKPIRGKDGFCIECTPGETGELLMPIQEGKPHTKFVG